MLITTEKHFIPNLKKKANCADIVSHLRKLVLHFECLKAMKLLLHELFL